MQELTDEIGLGVFVLGASEQLKGMFNIPSKCMPLVAVSIGMIGSVATSLANSSTIDPSVLIIAAGRGFVVGVTTTGTYAYIDKKTPN